MPRFDIPHYDMAHGMFHDVIAWLVAMVVHYGIVGLFVSSLIGSTIFVPFSVEAVLPFLIGLKLDIYQILIAASLGATIGTCVNYGIGFFATELVEKRVGKANLKKAKDMMEKYSWPGLFLILAAPIPLPIPVDPLTVLPGLAKMDFREFVVVVFFAKLAKYAFFVAVFAGVIGMLHI